MSITKEIVQKRPAWAKYRSQDRWGRIWVWSHEPSLEIHGDYEIWGMQDVESSRASMISFGAIPQDWRKTLVKIH